MKSTLLSLALLATSALAAPAPNSHGHNHNRRMHRHAPALKREAEADYVLLYETITVNAEGKAIGTATGTTTVTEQAQTAVVAGTTTPLSIKQTIQEAASIAVVAAVDNNKKQAAVTPTPTPTTPAAVQTTPTPTPTTTPTPTAAPTTPAPAPTTPSTGGNTDLAKYGLSSGKLSNPLGPWQAPSKKFVDGYYSCSSPPSDMEGVVVLSHLGMAGYTSIQIGNAAGSECTPGSYCSYACQPGMLKTQWPETQPSDGQSRGGLICKDDGKLYRTQTNTDYLCMWSYKGAFVTNKLSQGVAICQTDYPGSENMDIPTWAAPNSADTPLSDIDAANYWRWQGKPISSQFYVNKAGVSQDQGCQWNTPGSGMGNFSPLIFGASYVAGDGISYLSITANPETTDKANYSVTFRAKDGSSSVNGDCVYSNGAFSGSSATANGCTVGCRGACEYVIY